MKKDDRCRCGHMRDVHRSLVFSNPPSPQIEDLSKPSCSGTRDDGKPCACDIFVPITSPR